MFHKVYQYTDKHKIAVEAAIYRFLKPYESSKYCCKIKDMAWDQMNSIKSPQFIADSVYKLIDYEIKYCHQTPCPEHVLQSLKKAVYDALKEVE